MPSGAETVPGECRHLRRPAGAQGEEKGAGAGEEKRNYGERHRRFLQHEVEATRIEGFEAAETFVDPAREAAAFPIAQQLRAQHRREAEREEAGKGDRADHRRRQLAEEEAGLAGDEHDRHEDGADDERGRDDRETDLGAALISGGERRLNPPRCGDRRSSTTIASSTTDADRQHHRQQGEEVDRKAEHPQHRKAGEQA